MRTSWIVPLSMGLAVTAAGCGWFGGEQNTAARHEAPVTTDSQAERAVAPPNTTATTAGTRPTATRSASNPTNQQVRQAQEKLQQLGLYKGRVDGFYGRQTIAAVDQFQAQNGLPRTGTLSNTTEQKLQTAQVSSPQNQPQTAQQPAPNNQPQTAQQPAPNNQPGNPQLGAAPAGQNPNTNPSANAPNNQPSH